MLAVTACPNGIANTYMAAEALTKTRQAAGGANDSFGHSLYKHLMNGVYRTCCPSSWAAAS